MAAIVLIGTTGCTGFFVPTCQENNDCGGTTGTYSSYAYVGNATTGTLAGFPVPTATFTTLTGTSYTLGTTPTALAATPSGAFLYVATLAGSIFVYTIGTNGALTIGNGGSPVVQALYPTWMTIDPSGNWLFVVSKSSPQLLIFQINTSTGVITQTSQGTVPLNSGNPTQVYVTPNNQYVYIGLGPGGTDGFTFNSSTGAVSGQIHLAPLNGASDNTFAADNDSAYLFVGEAGSGIRSLAIGTGGSLKEVTGSPFASQLGPQAIVVDPTNTYVYVANRTANVITGYTLGTGGTLTPLSSSPFSTGSTPNAMSLDSTGKYLFVVNSGGSPDMQVFSFDATTAGKLDSVTSVATGTDPTGAVALSIVP
ncbi:MAG TPA: beta-propeller fold lactonase family protein [Acidobacteriaceae bacterium]|nr:beta-propeller fold lactonase family protein [Acidobacteriaceae bacterium]